MKIALFDDHPVILDALANYFSKKEGVEVVGILSRKSEVVQLLESCAVDILIADVLTDESLGLELFEEIQAGGFETKVIVYSSLQGEVIHNFLFEYGVVAIVNKIKGLDELWQVVEVAFKTSEFKKKSKATLPPSLTPKEREIVHHLARGLAAKEIAVLTQNSVNTINNQKNHLLAKFGCANTTELIFKLMHFGYIKM